MMSSSNQERNNDDEGSWQKREVLRAVASALANNLVTALIALALAVFAFVRVGVGQWMHTSVATWVVIALASVIVGILGFILGSAFSLLQVGYLINSVWKRFTHQPPPQRTWWTTPFDFLAFLGMMLTVGYWYATFQLSELKKQRQLQAAQEHGRAATQQDATTREQRIAELEQELAALRALKAEGTSTPAAEEHSDG